MISAARRPPQWGPRLGRVLRHFWPVVLSSVAIVFAILPLFWIALTSVKTDSDILTTSQTYLPRSVTFSNYLTVWERGNFPQLLWNSTVVTLMTIAICLTIGTLAAYSLSRNRFRGRTGLMMLFLSIRMFPFVLMLIPSYIILRNLGLLDSRLGLALAYTTFSLPATVWLMKNFFDAIPTEIEDAARIDGCSRAQVFLRIALPLSRPGLIATAILVGIGSWSEYLFALMLTTSQGSRTWPVGLALMVGEFQLPYGQLAATGVISIMPILVAYALFGRKLVGGLMGGAIKG